MRVLLQKLALLITSLLVAAAIGEAVLRVVSPVADGFYVWSPHLRQTFRPNPKIMPGIEGESVFITNSAGIRGDEFPAGDSYRILAIGGSTTECLYLDQTEAWPQRLQEKLGEAFPRRRVWVGNVGASGLNTRHYVVQMRHLLTDEANLNTVIILAGINDLSYRIGRAEEYDPDGLEDPEVFGRVFVGAFNVFPPGYGGILPLYKRTATYRFAAFLKKALFSRALDQDESGDIVTEWRRNRRTAGAFIDEVPDLTSALAEYTHNLNTLIDLAQAKGVHVVFLTQPSMWYPQMSPELESLLWMGGSGRFQHGDGGAYYSTAALSRAMRAYNTTLMAVCRNRGVDCVDLESVIPRDTTAFYDDVHFNEQGAERVASVIAEYVDWTSHIETEK